MNKKVVFGAKPAPKPEVPATPDKWVESRTEEEPLKRLTFDVPEGLHRAMKAATAQRGVTMREELLALLEAHYRPENATGG